MSGQGNFDTLQVTGSAGIGSAIAPQEKLEVDGNILVQGGIGIGITDHQEIGKNNNKLLVNGNLHMNGNPIYLRQGYSDQFDIIQWDSSEDRINIGGFNGVKLGFTNKGSLTTSLMIDDIGDIQISGGLYIGNNYNQDLHVNNNMLLVDGNLHMNGNAIYLRQGFRDFNDIIQWNGQDDRIEIGGWNGVNLCYTNSGSPSPALSIDASGDIQVTGKLSLSNSANLNDNPMYLRGDTNHGLEYNSESDGPLIFGYGGGYLGTVRDPSLGGYNIALSWNKDGKVGICTKAPQEALDVKGNIRVSGDINLIGADCAENFDIADGEIIEPGMVMVIDNNGALKSSKSSYDKRVAGVVSGAGSYRPGIILDKIETGTNRLPIALSGKVYCKVDAQYGPIDIGDLLTSSPTCGHAMKATDHHKALGAIIGKALRPLTEGQDLIPILVALQ